MKNSIVFLSLLILFLLIYPNFALCEVTNPREIIINLDSIFSTVKDLVGFGSRFTGYEGFYKTANYIIETIRNSTGLRPEIVNSSQLVPFDNGSYVLSDNEKIRVYPLYPNLVALGPKYVSGKLVYVGDGSIERINGLDLNGSIALIDFNSGKNWINLLQLGVKAFIFIEPNDTNRYEALAKISLAPINIVRVYAKKGEASKLISLVGKNIEIYNNVYWKEVTIPNILFKIDGEDKQNVIFIVVHYDSVSVVPSISPGANDAVNVAYALELIKSLIRNNIRPKNSIWFLFVGAHYQALAGSRLFVEKYIFNSSSGIGNNFFPYLAIGIDISDGSPKVNPVASGYFYSLASSYLQNRLSNLGFTLRKLINNFSESYPEVFKQVRSYELDSFTGFQLTGSPLPFPSGFAFRYTLDTEPFEAAGMLAFSFVTLYDVRSKFFTPKDSILNYNNIIPQIKFINYILSGLLLEPISSIYSGSWNDLSPVRIGSSYTNLGFSTLKVTTVIYDPTKPGLYSSVNNSIVVVSNSIDPFSQVIVKSDSNGTATIYGLRPATEAATAVYYSVRAYVLSNNNDILMAPDSGIHGSQVYPRSVSLLYYPTFIRTVVFEASSIVIPKIVVPSTLQAVFSSNSLFSSSNYYSSILSSYAGYENPIQVQITTFRIPGYAPLDSWHFDFDSSSSILVLFVPIHTKFGFLVKVSSLGYTYGLFINYTGNGEESGYYFNSPGKSIVIDSGYLGLIRDLWLISNERVRKQVSADVINPALISEMNMSSLFINKSTYNLKNNIFSYSLPSQLISLGLSSKVYISSLNVLKDATVSVIITFALVIPFVLLFSSLVYGLTRGMKSVMLVFSTSVIVSLVLTISHPGFKLVTNVPAIFVGALVVSLVLPALVFLFSNFSSGMSELRKRVFGEHFLERSGFDVSLSAVTIGIGNMRKRPLRTILTLTSIVLVSFALVSLTSFSEVKVFNVVQSKTSYPINGILIKTPSLYPMDDGVVYLLSLFLTNSSSYYPRYWVYLPTGFQQVGVPGSINLQFNTSSFGITALVGLNPREILGYSKTYKSLFSYINENLSLLQNSIFIPSKLASIMNSSGKLKPGSTVYVDGMSFVVAGVFNETSALNLRDADGFLGILPIDYSVSSQRQTFSFDQMDFSSVVIVNHKSVKQLPEACLTSVFIPVGNLTNEEISTLRSLIESLFSAYNGLNIYLVINGTVSTFSSRNVQSIFGFQYLVIPLVMAGLITMSTVLGSAMERTKESMIYSSVGLAPMQVGYMFLSENIVYAIVGGTLGYLIGLLLSHYLRLFGLLGNLGINYSSSSVLISIGLIILLVLVASIYPMYKVALLITPSLERRWRISTRPKGDEWEIPMPFRVKEEENLLGFIYFLREYLWNKRIERTGVFSVEDLSASKEEEGYSLNARVWLAPYEQGIHQDVKISFIKSKTEQRYIATLKILRVSGPYDSWVRFNYNFVDEIRKQFLVWSLISPEQLKSYIEKAKGEVQ